MDAHRTFGGRQAGHGGVDALDVGHVALRESNVDIAVALGHRPYGVERGFR
ncbi:hypothetical protein D3C83_314890 [compost metagenome]